jgi:hypothetical protein
MKNMKIFSSSFALLLALLTTIGVPPRCAADDKVPAKAPAKTTTKASAKTQTASASTQASAQIPAALRAGLPANWDKRIPIAAGAVVTHVSDSGAMSVVHEVEFTTAGDFQGLIDFYTNAIKKAGFTFSSNPLKIPARKAFNVNFHGPDAQDTLSLYPDAKDPSKFTVRVVYEPTPAAVAKAGNSVPAANPAPATAGKAATGKVKAPATMPY